MASPLDFQEQEQIDQLKAVWKKYGNLVVWTLVLALAAFGGWNWWGKRQQEQSVKASALYDELDKASQNGDLEKANRVFADMKQHYPGTAYMQQAGLLLAKQQFDKGQLDASVATLTWVSENAVENEYKTIARLGLAGVLLDQKKHDEALKQLAGADAKSFAALVADRRGDVLMAQGKKDEAKAAYQDAWKAMDATLGYRTFIEAKLSALGAAPAPADSAASAASGAKP